MKRFLLVINIVTLLFFLSFKTQAENNRFVLNGFSTEVINFPGISYSYIRANDKLVIDVSAVGISNALTIEGDASPPIIITGQVTGIISACAGSASVSPNIQQFTISGSNLTADITATAPPGGGFEISLTPGSGYGNSVIVNQTGGNVNNAVLYVRSSATASGSISGSVKLTSAGAPTQLVTVTGIVNALPIADPVTSQVVLNGAATTAINYTPITDNFNWTNNTPGIGLSASGIGNIPSFTAINNGSTAVTATINVTPISPGYAYIANENDGTVSVVNMVTNTVVATIPVGSNPIGVAASADGSYAYVVNNYSNSVSVISSQTQSVVATIPVGSFPDGAAINPDGSLLYVTNNNSNSVSVINTATNSVIATIPVGSNPYNITVSHDGTRVYVTNFASNTVSVINTATNAVVATILVGSYPVGVSVSPDGTRVYVTNQKSNTVSVINTATNSITATIPVGTQPAGVTVSPDGKRIYVANAVDNTISIISTSSNGLISTVNTGSLPYGISISPDGNNVYVVNEGSGTVSVISTATNSVISTISVGHNPYSIGNFITAGSGCSGTPVTFTIKVNPTPSIPTITVSTATGIIAACQGTASASPDIQQFTVSGSSLLADIVATAPPGGGFEVSLTAGSGYGNSITLTQSGGKVTNVVVYVRSSAAASGNILGKVSLTSTGAAGPNVAVKGTINALPMVNPLSSPTYTNGQSTTAISFTGTGNTFNWINDTPGIGLAASGTGDIASFTAVNTGSTTVVANVTVTPISAAILYLADYNNSSVLAINTATKKIIKVPVGSSPVGVSVSPDGSRIYVTNNGSNSVSVINAATNTFITTVSVGSSPEGLAVSPDGSRVYVANNTANTVSVINTATNTVSTTIPVAGGPYCMAVSSDGSRAYVTNNIAGTVAVINTATNAVLTNIPVGTFPFGVKISTDGSHVYVANSGSNSVSVINTATNSVIATVAVGTHPFDVTLSPDGSKLYVPNYLSNDLSVINTATNTVIATVPTGTNPANVSVSPDGSLLYVTNSTSKDVSVINTATNTIQSTIPLGATSYSIGNLITSNFGCPGVPAKFTITATPTAIPVITAGTATGNISACAGSPSSSPNIQHFTVSGSNLTNNITTAAPTGFEVSLSANSGYGNSITLTQIAGNVSSTIIYVRSSAAATGNISGNVTLTSGAESKSVAVTGVVNALPTVNAIADQTKTNGNPTDPVNFTGTGNSFAWTNDTPGIGLAASGTGDIASFTAVNTGSSDVKAKITVTPKKIGYAYIANQNANTTVSVINTSTNAVIATVDVGVRPNGVAISPDDSKAFISNSFSDNISVINTSTNKVTSTISLATPADAIAISPDGSRLYVASGSASTITVINAVTGVVITTIPVDSPTAISISPDGSKVYVTDRNSQAVTVLNTSNNTVAANIQVGLLPYELSGSPDGSKVYVTNSNSNSVSVINTVNNTVINNIPVGTYPTGILFSPDGSLLYVVNSGDNSVMVINAATNAIVATIPVGPNPVGISVTSDGSQVYVTNTGADNVSVINTQTNTVVNTITVGVGPTSIGNFITKGSNCTGSPITFTITVKANLASPKIIASLATGNISVCVGLPSASPNIQKFTVSATLLTADITATAPPGGGFEVSLTAVGGYSNSVTLTQSGGTVNNTTIYVRSSATATGSISGIVTLTSGSASQNVAVAGIVNALSVVNQVASPVYTNGDATTAISFTGTGDAYTWINNTPGIGLAASGTGDIASFTAVNTGNTAIKTTVTVTPVLASYAYIANVVGSSVSVINTIDNSTVTTIPVGSGPNGVAVSPDGSKVYVTNLSSGTVSVINTQTNTATATINVGTNPRGIAVSPDGSLLYVANSIDNTVSVINTANNISVATITAGGFPEGVAITPDGSKVYVTNYNGNSVTVIDAKTNAVITTIITGSSPFGITVSPDGSRVYVANLNSQNISVINTQNNTIITNISVGSSIAPIGISLSPDGSRLYVANEVSNDVSVINTANNSLITTIPVGAGPYGISVSGDGSRVYVVNNTVNNVSVINTADNSVIATVPVGASPTSIGNFVKNATGCIGQPITFTITVNPSSISSNIIARPVTGNIFACVGTASASPNVQRFTVSASQLTGDITASAPNGFELSLTISSGYASSLTIPQTSGNVSNTVVYVRSAASALVGGISGSISLTSGAISQSVNVTGIINALPTVNPLPSPTYANGASTTPINFTGTGDNFTWTNDLSNIGLAPYGVGDIASFKAANTGSTAVIAHISVTPISAGYIYVPNLQSNDVSVYNTITNTLVTTIPVGNTPTGLSLNPDGSRAYVANSKSNNVSVINTATNKVITTIPVGLNPAYVFFSADGSRAFVPNWDSNTVSVINTSTNAVTATVTVASKSIGVAASPDGSKLYITYGILNKISVIDVSTNTVIANVPVGSSPEGIVASPDGTSVYVTNYSSNNVMVISTATNTVVATIPVGSAPDGIAISPDGSRIYVSNNQDNTVSVINAATNAIITTVNVGRWPFAIAVSPDGSVVAVANNNDDAISLINTTTNAISSTVSTGLLPLTNTFGNFIKNGSGCGGAPANFTITVNPTVITATITATGALLPLTTTYGTPSASTSFTVSGTNTTVGILITPPAGFEVSTDNVNFSPTVTVGGAGAIASTTIYVRLAQTTAVGPYSGNIVLSTAGAANLPVPTANSIVNPAQLTIIANDVHKTYGTVTNQGGPGSIAFTSTGLQNAETIGSVTITFGTGSAAGAEGGTYIGKVVVSAAVAGTFNPNNYTIAYKPGNIIVDKVLLTAKAENKSKVFGTDNPVLVIDYSGFVNGDNQAQLIAQPVIATAANITSAPGQYAITVTGGVSNNYTFNDIPGILTVTSAAIALVIPNTFTPNGDGINDTWDIKNIDNYPDCTLNIYTRWGQQVFSSIGYGASWNGTYNGKDLPLGTYYYIINLKNDIPLLSGYVVIIR